MYVLITLVLIIILYISYYKIINKPGEHRSGLTIFLPGIIAIFILISETTLNHPKDVKLVNHVAEKLRCYESWKESVDGKKVVHPIRYSLICNKDEELFISKNMYDYFFNLWDEGDNTSTIVDGYQVIETKWNDNPWEALIISKPVSYENYMINIYKLYNIHDVGVQKAIERGLFIRQGVGVVNNSNVLEPRQDLILGINVEDSIQRRLNYIASLDPMFRPILLVWPYEEENKVSQQRNLWTGGKENEVVFCVGLGEDNEILWSGSFSWDESRKLETYILRDVLKPGNKLDLDNYIASLESGYTNNYWNPINLENYGFVKLPLNQLLTIGLMSIVVIVNIILVVKLILLGKKK